ncbi:MAG: hypothetical protein AAGH64_02260 [Planctomycetota bacterium]
MVRTASAIVVLAAAGSAATAQVVLEIDTSVINQITITATSVASANDADVPDVTGILLADMLDGTAPAFPPSALTDNPTLTPFLDPSGSPTLSVDDADEGSDTGLNVWSMSATDRNTFMAGTRAFAGTATWEIPAGLYDALAAPGSSGAVFAGIANSRNLFNGVYIGDWLIVPAPGAGALLAMTGLAAVRRRRA